MTSRKNAATLRYLRKEISKHLRKEAVGRHCSRHKKVVKLGVLWADGRAIAFFCSKECYWAWAKSQGEWGEVVQVVPVNR